jgi:hypothetical protein
VFTDSGPLALSITTNGNAQIDTAQSKFGGASGLFDGTGDYLRLPANAGLNPGAGDFTLEFFFRVNAWASSSHLFMGNASFTIQRDNVSNLIVYDGSNRNLGSLPGTGAWHHFALVRSGGGSNNTTAYLNGASAVQWTQTGATIFNSSSGSIAGRTDGTLAFNGWIDELRFTSGVARYTGAFTPPAAPFPDN